MPRYSPMPGWLAMKLSSCGHDLALSLLAGGLLACADRDEGDPVNAERFYLALADSDDPLFDLRKALERPEFTYLADALAPLMGWAEYATPATERTVKHCARILAEVDYQEAASNAGGDLLGQVRVELEIAERGGRRPSRDYLELTTAVAAALIDPTLPRAGHIFDGWCASGVRVMGIAVALHIIGRDPLEISYLLRDPDPINLSLAAVNLAVMGLPNVELEVADGIMSGRGPLSMMTLDDLERGDEVAFLAPGMSGLDGMEAIVAAQMAAEPIIRAAEARKVRDILVDAQAGPGTAAATRVAVANHRKKHRKHK